MTLPELIAALEAATKPSRELDAQIHRAVTPAYADMLTDTESLGRASDTGWLVGGNHDQPIRSLRYTASLDAALSLVPPGWDVREANSNGGLWMFVLGKGDDSHPGYREAWSWPGSDFERGIFHRKPAAIALCIAALRARLAKGEGA